MAALFGAEGIRAVANTDLSCETAMKIGRAAAFLITHQCKKRALFLVGKDTRASGDMLLNALISGLCSCGADVIALGTVPVPAVSLLVRHYAADAGIMVSASHAAFEYNGFNFFDRDGAKISPETEFEIESLVLGGVEIPCQSFERIGRCTYSSTAAADYVTYIKSTAECSLKGLRIGIDCANGSASFTARDLFSELGAQCYIISDEPSGSNINKGCGAGSISALSQAVCDLGLDCGFAFDGNADGCIAVDETGAVIDGDTMLAIMAKRMLDNGTLRGGGITASLMSNMGLERFCRQNGLGLSTCAAGDRAVLCDMLRNGYNLGGESDGHIIFLDSCSTGDGQLTALKLLCALKSSGKKMSALAAAFHKSPQSLINVRVSVEGQARFEHDRAISDKIKQAQAALAPNGRLLVRASGTEPVLRILAEGSDSERVRKVCREVADFITFELGTKSRLTK